MAQTIREIMTPDPITLKVDDSIMDAARCMRDANIGPVVIMSDGDVCGIITDRDIVTRAIAEGKDLTTRVGDICSSDLTTVEPDADADEAVKLMRENAIRRVPVVEDGRPVGIISIGDLAVEKDPSSALADISAAPPSS